MTSYTDKLEDLIGIPKKLTNNPTLENLVAVNQEIEANKAQRKQI